MLADGVMLGEIIHYYSPKSVNMTELYSQFNLGTKNWINLNKRFLIKWGCGLKKADVDLIVGKKKGCLSLLNKVMEAAQNALTAQDSAKQKEKTKEEQAERRERAERTESDRVCVCFFSVWCYRMLAMPHCVTEHLVHCLADCLWGYEAEKEFR